MWWSIPGIDRIRASSALGGKIQSSVTRCLRQRVVIPVDWYKIDTIRRNGVPMKLLWFPTLSASVLFAIGGIASGQTPPRTLDSYIGTAKVAAGTDWAGTFLRLCIPPPAGAAGPPADRKSTPARETWYAEPAKVADNFYFIGTKVHNA